MMEAVCGNIYAPTRGIFVIKAQLHRVNAWRTLEERTEKMVCAPLFDVIRFLFVERAAPTFLIRDHSLGASSSAHNFEHV